MEIVVGWIAFSIVAGVIAGAKNRSAFGCFLLSLLLSPLIGIILAAAMPRIETAPSVEAVDAPSGAGRVPCPMCSELIMPTAKVCRFCGHPIPPPPPPPVVDSSPPAARPSSTAYKAGKGLGKLFRSDDPPPPKDWGR
jgi:hypothetical protein